MKKQLEIGDKIMRIEVITPMSAVYEITKVTKTLAKTSDGVTFFRDIDYNTTKPLDHYVGEVDRKNNIISSTRYFLIK